MTPDTIFTALKLLITALETRRVSQRVGRSVKSTWWLDSRKTGERGREQERRGRQGGKGTAVVASAGTQDAIATTVHQLNNHLQLTYKPFACSRKNPPPALSAAKWLARTVFVVPRFHLNLLKLHFSLNLNRVGRPHTHTRTLLLNCDSVLLTKTKLQWSMTTTLLTYLGVIVHSRTRFRNSCNQGVRTKRNETKWRGWLLLFSVCCGMVWGWRLGRRSRTG